MSAIKAVLIDPHTQTVSDIEVQYDGGLAVFYKLIDCDLVEFFHLGGGLALVIDEEGMLKDQVSTPEGDDTMPQAFFRVAKTPLAGRAVLVKLDNDGDEGFLDVGLSAENVIGMMDHPRGVMGWIGEPEKDRLMRSQHDDFIAMATAAGAHVDDCGDMVVVATFPEGEQ